MKKFAALALGLTMTMASHITPANANTLQNVQAKGFVQCGVHDNLPGFASSDDNGNWYGMDVDLCRSVAVAVLGDASKVKFTPLTPATMQSGLQSGEVDILASGSLSLTKDALSGTTFVDPMYHDQVGFLLSKNLGVKSALELFGASVCLVKGDASEIAAASFFAASGMTVSPIVLDTFRAAAKSLEASRCDVLAANQSALQAIRYFLEIPDSTEVLPEAIGFSMMGPQVRTNDEQWADIVRWTRNILVRAEILGITSMNVDEAIKSSDPEIRRFLGLDSSQLGTSQNNKLAYNIIRQVGNYGEIFESHIGLNTIAGLKRGMNATVFQGGLMISPNF